MGDERGEEKRRGEKEGEEKEKEEEIRGGKEKRKEMERRRQMSTEGQKRRGDEQRRRGWRAFVRELCRNFRLRNFDVILWFRIHFSSFHICIVLIPCPIVM